MKIKLFAFFFISMIFGCKKISESHKDKEDAILYTASKLKDNPYPLSEIKLMSWNIRFGIARAEWFGDACGNNTIFDKDLIIKNLGAITNRINLVNPDVLMMQECDVNSKRTSYTNEINYILDNTNFNYAYYGPVWQSQFIPSHGLGKMDMGIVIFSKWPLENAKRLSLPLRTDQSAAEKYFYLRYCLLKATLKVPGFKSLALFNVHAVAFATDDTKKKDYEIIKSEFDAAVINDGYFVCGGDFNSLPPNATKKDYCIEDMCDGEQFHVSGHKPEHKEGSDYTPEPDWINPLFTFYNPSLPLTKYLQNESAYYTHTTNHPDGLPNRRLDHFFTNHIWTAGSDTTFQDAIKLSDHAPISVKLKLPL